MIAHLTGRLLRCTASRVLLDVEGVGYELQVPATTFYELEKQGEGARISLWVRTILREGAIDLYGFWSERDREVFGQLVRVTGIGPRLAVTLLSGLPGNDLLRVLADGNLASLVAVPGIGKKTAERLVLELKDRACRLVAESPAASPSKHAADEDLLSALLNLGYKLAPAQRALGAARHELPDAGFGELLRASLRKLSRV